LIKISGKRNDADISGNSVVDTYSDDGLVNDPSIDRPDNGVSPYDLLGIGWEKPVPM